MEFDRTARAGNRYAAQTARIRRELEASGIPIVGLPPNTSPADERFGGLELADDTVTNVRIVYEGGQPTDPWASVDTSRWTGTPGSSGPLRSVVEHTMRRRGDRLSAAEWSDGEATVLVDGRPVPGRIVRAGLYWAARCEFDAIEITVAAWSWYPDAIAVETVTDLVPMLDRLATPPRPAHRPKPEPVPAGLGSEPHRALADAALRLTAHQAEWLADGGPEPELPRYWSALWQATVARQMELTGAPEPAARQGVRSIVNQLTSLHSGAAWFRDDARLRDRAIAETLLYGTEISDRVPSRPAQQAWQRQQNTAPAGPDQTEAQSRAAADQRWLAAWAEWARDLS